MGRLPPSCSVQRQVAGFRNGIVGVRCVGSLGRATRGCKPRTQASLAVSTDGERWVLLNASPDLRAQVQATPALQPRAGTRDTPIAAVVLTGAEVDQVAGLLALRERQNFTVLATSETLAALDANPIFRVLAGDVVTRKAVARNEPFALPGDLGVELFSVPGKVALYLEDDAPALAARPAANVGVELACGDRRLLYVPGAAAVNADLRERLTAPTSCCSTPRSSSTTR